MKYALKTVVSERSRGAFSNPATGWSYQIFMGSRCSGMTSNKVYPSSEKAYNAGLIMVKKLKLMGEDNG